jgi:hypothetical protein
MSTKDRSWADTWYFMITSEIALKHKTGLNNLQGSPLAQFREFFPECPRTTRKAIPWIKRHARDNELRVSEYFMRVWREIAHGIPADIMIKKS